MFLVGLCLMFLTFLARVHHIKGLMMLMSLITCDVDHDLFRNAILRTSLVVQWLRLHAPNAGCLGQGTRSHMLQIRPGAAK